MNRHDDHKNECKVQKFHNVHFHPMYSQELMSAALFGLALIFMIIVPSAPGLNGPRPKNNSSTDWF